MEVLNQSKQIPDFLLVNNAITPKHSNSTNKNYLERMFVKIKNIIELEFYQNNIAKQNGFLQNLDPRAKIISFLYIILTICLTQNLYFLVSLELIFIAIILYIGVSLKVFLKRIFLTAFLFSGILVIPAIFSFVTEGDTLLAITSSIIITKQGTISSLFVFFRSLSSLSITFILLSTTHWNDLTKALHFFKIPNIIIAILDFTYRYIFLFLYLLSDYILGRKSRIISTEKIGSKINWIGISIANFFRLSLNYTEDISLAMTARGYYNKPIIKNIEGFRNVDLYFIILTTIMFFMFLGGLFVDLSSYF